MKIFGLCGEKSAGKNTFATYAIDILTKVGTNAVEEALADPLKRFCMDFLDLPRESCYGTEAQKNAQFSEWGKIFSPKICLSFKKTYVAPISGREILQVVGTEIFRGSFQSSFWVDIMLRSTLPTLEQKGVGVVFITDVRFVNEVQLLKQSGAKIIRIRRNIERMQQIAHASELEMTKIPETEFANVVLNDGSLYDLSNKVLKVLEIEGLV